MPLSPKEKQAAYRARKQEDGLAEVRGIWLPPHLHERVRAYAQRLARQGATQGTTQFPSR